MPFAPKKQRQYLNFNSNTSLKSHLAPFQQFLMTLINENMTVLIVEFCFILRYTETGQKLKEIKLKASTFWLRRSVNHAYSLLAFCTALTIFALKCCYAIRDYRVLCFIWR